MELFLSVLCLIALIAVIYFAVASAQNRQAADLLEGENTDLRYRISELTREVRSLREASGLPQTESSLNKDDELMPIRRPTRSHARARGTQATADAWNTVLFVGSDPAEKARLDSVISGQGYHLAEATTASETQRIAHELTTAALVFDLRDSAIATIAQTVATVLGNDPLAKEVPLFALVSSAKDRERLQEEGVYTAAFTAPIDTSLLLSALSAALIRRKTRARRAEAARSILANFARS